MIIMVFKLRVGHRTGHQSHFSAPNPSKGTTSLGTERLLSVFHDSLNTSSLLSSLSFVTVNEETSVCGLLLDKGSKLKTSRWSLGNCSWNTIYIFLKHYDRINYYSSTDALEAVFQAETNVAKQHPAPAPQQTAGEKSKRRRKL